MNLLIADDDKTFCLLLGGEMRARGWTVATAGDAMQAVMFALRAPHDVIVLDVQMPGGTGVQALTKLKASTKTKTIPVVVVSASSDAAVEQKFLDMGAARFFRKPVDFDALDAALRDVCGAAPGSPGASERA